MKKKLFFGLLLAAISSIIISGCATCKLRCGKNDDSYRQRVNEEEAARESAARVHFAPTHGRKMLPEADEPTGY